MSKASKDALFDERKNEGNAFIKAKDYDNAIRYYTEALKVQVNKMDKDTRDEKRGAAFSNRSLAYLRSSASQPPRSSAKFLIKALQDAQDAIKCRPMWAKAHFRMGESLRHLGKNKEATECFLKAYMLDPKDKDLQGYLTRTSELAKLEMSTDHLSYKMPQQCAVAGAVIVLLLVLLDYYNGAKGLPNIVLRIFSVIAAAVIGGVVGFLLRMQHGISREQKLKPPMVQQLEEKRDAADRFQQEQADEYRAEGGGAEDTPEKGERDGHRKKVRSTNKSKRNRDGAALPPLRKIPGMQKAAEAKKKGKNLIKK